MTISTTPETHRMQTTHEQALDMKKGSRGRKAFNPETVQKRLDHLVNLYREAKERATDLKEAIDATAEEADVAAAVLRKFVAAKAGDKFDQKKLKVEQLALVFEEVA